MMVVFLLLIASLTVAAAFVLAFIWAVRNGQYEDLTTPAMRVLSEDDVGQGTAPRE